MIMNCKYCKTGKISCDRLNDVGVKCCANCNHPEPETTESYFRKLVRKIKHD